MAGDLAHLARTWLRNNLNHKTHWRNTLNPGQPKTLGDELLKQLDELNAQPQKNLGDELLESLAAMNDGRNMVNVVFYYPAAKGRDIAPKTDAARRAEAATKLSQILRAQQEEAAKPPPPPPKSPQQLREELLETATTLANVRKQIETLPEKGAVQKSAELSEQKQSLERRLWKLEQELQSTKDLESDAYLKEELQLRNSTREVEEVRHLYNQRAKVLMDVGLSVHQDPEASLLRRELEILKEREVGVEIGPYPPKPPKPKKES